MDDGEKPLDLGKQAGLLESSTAVLILMAVSAGYAVTSPFADHDVSVYQGTVVVLVFLRCAWLWATWPRRAEVGADGVIEFRGRRRVRRVPARELITIERVGEADYVLEWGPGSRRTPVRDGSGRLQPTLSRLNPNAAVMDLRSGKGPHLWFVRRYGTRRR